MPVTTLDTTAALIVIDQIGIVALPTISGVDFSSLRSLLLTRGFTKLAKLRTRASRFLGELLFSFSRICLRLSLSLAF